MSNNLREVKLVMTNMGGNNNKYWTATMDESFTVHVEYGRVDCKKPQSQIKSFGSESAANTFIDSKVKQKEKKGYKQAKIMSYRHFMKKS